MDANCALANQACTPCRGEVPALAPSEQEARLSQLPTDWQLVEHHHLEKVFPFRDFAQALAFTNAAGAVAEQEHHHPELILTWGKVTVRIWTHKIDGLTHSDFVLAAKIDRAYIPSVPLS